MFLEALESKGEKTPLMVGSQLDKLASRRNLVVRRQNLLKQC